MLTAVQETKHTVTTSEGKTIHKKISVKIKKNSVAKEIGGEKKTDEPLHQVTESSVKETTSKRTKEYMESPKTQMNRAAATPSQQCRKRDQPTVTSSQPPQRRTAQQRREKNSRRMQQSP